MNSTTISAIIIDDEPDAIHLLEMYLRQFPFIEVIGQTNQPQKGLDLAKEYSPELIFLDIDMPDMNGLQVADKIQSVNLYSEIVFTTAHQQYAYDALGIEPLDFLTKPFCVDDLEIVIQKFKTKTEKKKLELKADKFLQSQLNVSTIKLPTVHGVLIINLKDIVILKSKGNYCHAHLQDGTTELITKNISAVVDLLNSPSFLLINRSTCINLNYLKQIDRKNNKCILGYNGKTIEQSISRNHLPYFDKLNIFPVI
jgi:two-component system LytT family response regulator